jgi:beta propeller repeat protein
MYDLSTKEERRITNETAVRWNFDVFEGVVFYTDGSNMYTYKVSTNQTTKLDLNITVKGIGDINVYKDKMVYTRYIGEGYNSDVYLYDFSTRQEIPICPDPNDQIYPAVYNDKVVWADNRNVENIHGKYHNWDIYLYNMSSGEQVQLTTDIGEQTKPKIYEDKIIWNDYGKGRDISKIYLMDLSNNTTTYIKNGSVPDIYRETMVFGKAEDIYLYNISTGEEYVICNDTRGQYSPKIYENIVVWIDERNFNPPPHYFFDDFYLSCCIPLGLVGLLIIIMAITVIVWSKKHKSRKIPYEIPPLPPPPPLSYGTIPKHDGELRGRREV